MKDKDNDKNKGKVIIKTVNKFIFIYDKIIL